MASAGAAKASAAATAGAATVTHNAPIVASKAAEAARPVTVRAGAVASTGAAKAGVAASAGAAAAERGATALVGEEKVHAAKEHAASCASTATHAASSAAAHLEEEARKRAYVLLERGVERAMPRVERFAKNELLDPDMPRPVVRGLEAIVEASMVELREVITESLTEGVLKQPPRGDEKLTAPPPRCCGRGAGCCGPCRRVRAFVLYHLFPHDRSVWASLRDPWWWLFMLIGAFPLWGVRVGWWGLVFLLKDKSDDFQLCTFVITFKASLFIAGGVQGAFLSSAFYTACTEAATCDTAAPGSYPAGFEFGVIGALVQAVVCWLAMLRLP